MIQIPLRPDISSAFTQRINLENNLYQIDVRWNSTEDCFYMNISKDNVNILYNIKLIKDYRLLRDYAIESIPGDFILYDLEQDTDGQRIQFDNLGTRYVLLYLTTSDLTEIYGSGA